MVIERDHPHGQERLNGRREGYDYNEEDHDQGS